MSSERKNEISAWYEQHSGAIFRYIVLMVRDNQQAEDLMQETFIKAFRYYDSFERKANPKTWLFSIAHNLTIDYLRKQKPIETLKELLLIGSKANPLPEEMVEIKENSKELYNALGHLKSSHREIIILRKIREFSIQETAEILNWSESKVKKHSFSSNSRVGETIDQGGDYRWKELMIKAPNWTAI